MKVLVLAPQPFYKNRGTPIAVRLLLRVLTGRAGTDVDLLTYHEGKSPELSSLEIYSASKPPGVDNIPPGFSWKKILADVLLFFQAFRLLQENDYDLIHAGEESVFFAMFFQWLYGIPYAYDMDSSIAQQLVEQKPYLEVLSGLFHWMERQAIQQSLINFPVCNALADLCRQEDSRKTVTLHDISQLDDPKTADPERLRKEVDAEGLVFLYVGNLEPYQGIDLLLDSFQKALMEDGSLHLVVIGGSSERIDHYQSKASHLEIQENTRFLGPRPFEHLGDYLAGADVLVCPRVEGVNTPMKIFPYLHSGRPVLATDLRTHNQILTSEEALLAPADVEGLADGMITLAKDDSLRERLGQNGRAFVERNHTFEAHRDRVNRAYDWIEETLEEPTSGRRVE